MSDIPTNVFRQILSYVPVEPLLRFKSVCKGWLSLINNPDFIKLHMNRQKEQLLFFNSVPENKFELHAFSLDSLISSKPHFTDTIEATPLENLTIQSDLSVPVPRVCTLPVASCLGLILIHHRDETKEFAMLWNPFTGEFLELPKTKPYIGVSVWGLGYDYVTKDYKAVRITPLHPARLESLIYCLKSKSWRKNDVDFKNCVIPCRTSKHIAEDPGVFVGGRLHWIVLLAEENMYTNERRELKWVLCFDVAAEDYELLSLPEEVSKSEDCNSVSLVALGERLGLSLSNKKGGVNVWVLKSFREGSRVQWDNPAIRITQMWTKIFTVEKPPGVSGYMISPRPIAYLDNQGVLIKCSSVKYEADVEEFLWVDVKKKCTKKITIEGKSGYFAPQVFLSSLTRLSEGNQVDVKKKSTKEIISEGKSDYFASQFFGSCRIQSDEGKQGAAQRAMSKKGKGTINRLELKITSDRVWVPPKSWFKK